MSISEAITSERVVAFEYAKPGDTPMMRVVSPFEVSGDGESFVGFDHEREALRAFRFDRAGEFEPVDEVYTRPVER